jgi:hypothetical protein
METERDPFGSRCACDLYVCASQYCSERPKTTPGSCGKINLRQVRGTLKGSLGLYPSMDCTKKWFACLGLKFEPDQYLSLFFQHRTLGGLERWNLNLDSLREDVLMEVRSAKMDQQESFHLNADYTQGG